MIACSIYAKGYYVFFYFGYSAYLLHERSIY